RVDGLLRGGARLMGRRIVHGPVPRGPAQVAEQRPDRSGRLGIDRFEFLSWHASGMHDIRSREGPAPAPARARGRGASKRGPWAGGPTAAEGDQRPMAASSTPAYARRPDKAVD